MPSFSDMDEPSYKEKQKNDELQLKIERMRQRTQIIVALLSLIGVIVALFPANSSGKPYKPVIEVVVRIFIGDDRDDSNPQPSLTPNIVETYIAQTLTAIASTQPQIEPTVLNTPITSLPLATYTFQPTYTLLPTYTPLSSITSWPTQTEFLLETPSLTSTVHPTDISTPPVLASAPTGTSLPSGHIETLPCIDLFKMDFTTFSDTVPWVQPTDLPDSTGYPGEINYVSYDCPGYSDADWYRNLPISITNNQLAIIFGYEGTLPGIGTVGQSHDCFLALVRGPINMRIDLLASGVEIHNVSVDADTLIWAASRASAMQSMYPESCARGIDLWIAN